MGILNSSIVGTIISMILIYSLLSILVSILLELWNSLRNIRAKNLENNIGLLLGRTLANKFYEHYMISGQITDEKKKPDNITDDLFMEVFTDIILQGSDTIENEVKKVETEETKKDTKTDTSSKDLTSTKRLDVMQKAISSMDQNPKLKKLLEAFHFKSENFDEFEDLVKGWYEDFNKRTSSWYKKGQRLKLFFTGLFVALLLNVDSVFLFNVISKNDTLRNELVAVAENVNDEYKKLEEDQKQNIDNLLKVSQDGLKKAKAEFSNANAETNLNMNKAEIDQYLNKVEELLKMTDTVVAKKYEKTQEAFTLVADLSLPIGWNKKQAPLSWIYKTDNDEKKQDNGNNKKNEQTETALEKYVNDRNQDSSNFLLYLFGIIVTAGSLSFGAPFWFEMLSKVVDIRNIGKSKTPVKKKQDV